MYTLRMKIPATFLCLLASTPACVIDIGDYGTGTSVGTTGDAGSTSIEANGSSGSEADGSSGSGDGSSSGDGTTVGSCVETDPYQSHYACGDECFAACTGDGLPLCANGRAGPLASCSSLCELGSDCEPFKIPGWAASCVFQRCMIPCNVSDCPSDYECVIQTLGKLEARVCMPHAL